MTIKELVQSAKEFKFFCSPDVITKYSEAGLLPVPTGGGRGRGKAAQYPEETLPRLLLLLRLRQEYPAGFGLYYNDALFDFIGRGEEADLLLPALLYIMEIPTANADAAREAARKVLMSDLEKLKTDIERHEHRTDALPVMLFIAQGKEEYQDPEIYSIPDDRDNAESPTLLDELKEIVSEWQFLVDAVEERDIALLARINEPNNKIQPLQQASEENLLLAAFVARFLFEPTKKRFRPPYGNALLHCWLTVLSMFRHYPQLIEMVKAARPLLSLASDISKEVKFPKRITTFEEVFNIAVKTVERNFGNCAPTDKAVG